jgi:hypothetical protein
MAKKKSNPKKHPLVPGPTVRDLPSWQFNHYRNPITRQKVFDTKGFQGFSSFRRKIC